MKRTYKAITALFFLLLTTVLAVLAFTDETSIAVVNVNVIPMNTEVILNSQTVIIRKGKIAQLGPSNKVEIPTGAMTIDGTDKFLIPGLFDMHAHFFYEQGENKNTCASELKMMLANGLTTVRIECGDSVYLEARSKVRDKKLIGPRLFVSSPQFVGSWPWKGKVFAKICKTPGEAISAVKGCKAEGYDEIKITFMVKREVYDAIIKTAKEENIKVTGHVGPLVKLPAALAAGQQIEHMDEFIDMLLPDTSYNHGESVSDMNIWRKKAWATVPSLDEGKLPELVDAVRKANIFVTPTNFFFFSSFADSVSPETFKNRVDYGFIPETIKKERWSIREHYWKNPPPMASREKYIYLRKKMTRDLANAGVRLMAGSDSPEWFNVQGFSIHDELQTFVDCGLTNYQALETATKNPATYLGILREKGTIEKDKDADFVLLNANPIENISNTRDIKGVMLQGKWYSRVELDRLLKEAKNELSL